MTIPISSVPSKDTDEERLMDSKSDNIELIIHDNADKISKLFFKSVLKKYQIRL